MINVLLSRMLKWAVSGQGEMDVSVLMSSLILVTSLTVDLDLHNLAINKKNSPSTQVIKHHSNLVKKD